MGALLFSDVCKVFNDFRASRIMGMLLFADVFMVFNDFRAARNTGMLLFVDVCKVFNGFPWIIDQGPGIASRAKTHGMVRRPIQLAEKLDFTKVFQWFQDHRTCPSFGVNGPAWQITFSTRFYTGLQQSFDLQGVACFPLPVCCTLFHLPQPF